MKIVELIYNPYVPNLKIKINNQNISEFSQLIQFFDEPIWYWKDKLFDILYDEIKEDYILYFTGTLFHQQLIDQVIKNEDHCKKIILKNYDVNINLQNRLKDLDRIYKSHNFNISKIINKFFLVYLDDSETIISNLKNLEISNSFCEIKFQIINESSLLKASNNIFISNKYSNIERISKKYINSDEPNYFIYLQNKKNRFLKFEKNNYIFESNEETLVNTIFDIMLTFPLEQILSIVISTINKNIELKGVLLQKIRKVTQIDPIVKIKYESTIEIKKSKPIKIVFIPEISKEIRLIYRSLDKEIATCDGMYIYGHNEGKTRIEVYKEGEAVPCEILYVTVIKRNRITSLLFDDDFVQIGINDIFQNKLSYFPEDADNISNIQWKVTDPSVLSLLKNGVVKAKNVGECRLICTVENVSVSCNYRVLPYLERIELNIDNPLVIERGKDLDINVSLYPVNAIDGQYSIKSLNMDIVNVIGNTLSAKKIGETEIQIENNTKRISKSIKIQVVKKKKKGKFWF